ncbi:MAG TPA: endonuclease/exonuclease/phosphatase family protein [Chitinophagaceae bacterium]|nr:endonuclease/exonuclease/phosphatase family protein [Chitinophagaceae bacterium]
MKVYYSFFLFLLSFSALSQTRIKVLTYNIFHGELPYSPGKPNLDSIAKLINQLQPDFVACQEVDSATGRSEVLYGKRTDLIKELAAKTSMFGYFGKALEFEGGSYGEGILSKTPLKVSTLSLPIPAGGEPRTLIYANTRLANGQNIIFGGTHLCHQSDSNRVAQVQSIDQLYRSLLVPSIVCGDFNFENTESPYKLMMNYWRDAAEIRTIPPNTFSSDQPTKRIDYLFVTKRGNWKLINAEVFPVKYSDHLPVLFTLELTLAE